MRSHLSYANVVATLALFLALSTGGAWAASKLITGKQVARNTITSANVKDGSLTRKDLSASERRALTGKTGPAGSAGATGETGQQGAQGLPGPQGERGPAGTPASAAPTSGQTITGRGNFDIFRDAINSPFNFQVDLRTQLAAAPTGYGVGTRDYTGAESAEIKAVFNDSSEDPTCTGTSKSPTAPSGRVCLYLSNAPANAKQMAVLTTETLDSRLAFLVNGLSANAGPIRANYAWAYTAP